MKKKESFFNKLMKKIPKPIKQTFVTSAIMLGSFFGFSSAAQAKAAPAPSPTAKTENIIVDNIKADIGQAGISNFSDETLRSLIDSRLPAYISANVMQNELDSLYANVGQKLATEVRNIHEDMKQHGSRRINNYLSNAALGIDNIDGSGLKNAPIGSHCSWAAIRSLMLAINETGTENLFSPYMNLMENINYAYAGFGYNAFKGVKEFHSSQKEKQKDLKENLIKTLKTNPDDMVVVAIASTRAQSGYHVVLMKGNTYYGYNRQRIDDAEKLIKSSSIKYYINVTEYARNNIDKEKLTSEMKENIFNQLREEKLKFKPDYSSINISNPSVEQKISLQAHNEILTDFIIQGNFELNKDGAKIINRFKDNVVKYINKNIPKLLSSSSVSEQDKIMIATEYQDIIGKTPQDYKANNLTISEVAQHIGKQYIKASKEISKSKMTEQEKTVYQNVLNRWVNPLLGPMADNYELASNIQSLDSLQTITQTPDTTRAKIEKKKFNYYYQQQTRDKIGNTKNKKKTLADVFKSKKRDATRSRNSGKARV